jgi:hypothetical protein
MLISAQIADECVMLQARQAQEPIMSAGKSLIRGACKMLEAAKQLAINPKDPPTYQQYSNHSKSVSDAIKRQVSAIRYVLSSYILITGFHCELKQKGLGLNL